MAGKIDRQGYGVLAGLLLPLLGVYLYYLLAPFSMSFGLFISNVFQMHLTAKVLSLGVLANLIGFLIVIGFKWDRFGRGIVLATFIYAAIILIFRFLV